MKPFRFSPASFADAFRTSGYVHIRNAVDPEFLRFTMDQLQDCERTGRSELSGRAIKNKKKQYLFDFPDDNGATVSELISSVSALTGSPESEMTISERHIMIYDMNAAPAVKLHKDRLASQISVGIPLSISLESCVALLPYGAREVNSLEHAIYSAKEVEPTARSVSWDTIGLEPPGTDRGGVGLELVKLDARPGDIVVFAGSSMYHARLNAAQSATLYFKFNSMRLDPLGEHP